MKKDKGMCLGCRDNFYNGNNPYGIKECWFFKSAKVVKRVVVPIDQRPPWTQPPVMVLDCRHERGAVLVKPDNPGCRP